MKSINFKLALLSGAAIALLPTFALAAAAEAAPDAVAEVVVTAQKRSENLQNVPVSMTVVTSEQLSNGGVRNFQDLGSVAPSLTITGGGTGQNSSVLMRGVGAVSFSYLTEPDVAIIIDDVPVASQSQAFTGLADVSQIEVLRGPQTTLFGKSASGGVVSITTQAPTRDFTGRVAASVTDDGQQTFDGAVSGPITDTLSYRLSAALDYYRGGIKNIATGHWLNGEDLYNLRGKLRWTPTDKLTVDLSATYINAWGSIGIPQIPVFVTSNAVLFNIPASTAYSGLNINYGNSSVKNDIDAANNYDIGQASVKAAYDAGPVTLLSITGVSNYHNYSINDFDGTASNVVGLATAGAITGSQYQYFSQKTNQVSQEFRAVSGPGAFRYVAGLWYAHKTDYYNTLRGPFYASNRAYANYVTQDYSTQYAAYAQSEWDFAPQFTLVTGLRYGDEIIGYHMNNIPKAINIGGSHSKDAITGKVSLQYRPVSNINLFASFTRGYKGETYDLSSSFTLATAALGPVKPETSKNYELGAKTQFFDRRLTLNLTVFDAQYLNFQAQTIIPSFGAGFLLANVGELETRGVELDGSWKPERALTVSFGGAYLDPVIRSFPNGQCYYTQTLAQGCTPGPLGSTWNLQGKGLPNAPKWKGNVDVQYTTALANTGFDAVLNASFRYQTKVNYALSPDPRTEQGAFGIVNIGAAVQPSEGARYKIGVFVNNLFDKHYYNGLTDLSALSTANTQGHIGRDFRRYAGVRASYAF